MADPIAAALSDLSARAFSVAGRTDTVSRPPVEASREVRRLLILLADDMELMAVRLYQAFDRYSERRSYEQVPRGVDPRKC
jgi:hypothetical protein